MFPRVDKSKLIFLEVRQTGTIYGLTKDVNKFYCLVQEAPMQPKINTENLSAKSESFENRGKSLEQSNMNAMFGTFPLEGYNPRKIGFAVSF